MKKDMIEKFLKLLEDELLVAQGCTEPISGAFVGATAKEYIDGPIKKIDIVASKNIIKNAKGVNIPNGDSLKGIEASIVLGMISGDSSKKLEVLNGTTHADVKKAIEVINSNIVTLNYSDTVAKLHIKVTLTNESGNTATVEVMHSHTNIINITKDSNVVLSKECDPNDFLNHSSDKSFVTVENIIKFIESVDVDKLTLVERQIDLNRKISEEGLSKSYGMSVGKTLKTSSEDIKFDLNYDIRRIAESYASAGSDARMSGNTLPVGIISGSGNQGITASIPVYIYAKFLEVSDEKLLKAVALSDLITIHIKSQIGKLSPVCGVSISAIGAGCGLMYLVDSTYDEYANMIMNNIATNTGMICDGASRTCAMKIQSSIQASIMAANMAIEGKNVELNEGIIGSDVEQSIKNMGRIAQAMNPIDDIIVDIMSK